MLLFLLLLLLLTYINDILFTCHRVSVDMSLFTNLLHSFNYFSVSFIVEFRYIYILKIYYKHISYCNLPTIVSCQAQPLPHCMCRTHDTEPSNVTVHLMRCASLIMLLFFVTGLVTCPVVMATRCGMSRATTPLFSIRRIVSVVCPSFSIYTGHTVKCPLIHL